MIGYVCEKDCEAMINEVCLFKQAFAELDDVSNELMTEEERNFVKVRIDRLEALYNA